MGNKMPAAAKPPFLNAPISQSLVENELAAAIKQARAGKFDLFLAWCRTNSKPMALADVVALAFKTVGELAATVSLDNGQDPDGLDAEYLLLTRARPDSVAKAQEIAERIIELDTLRHTVRNRRDDARAATGYLESIRAFLPEFFGLDPEAVKVQTLPPAFCQFCVDAFGSQPSKSWRDIELPPPMTRVKPRKVRVAGV